MDVSSRNPVGLHDGDTGVDRIVLAHSGPDLRGLPKSDCE